MRRAEERILASLLRLPYRALPWPAYFNLGFVGGVQIRSAEALVRAAAFRFAWEGREEWARCVRRLRAEVRDARPLAALGTNSLRTAPWDREPLAWGLWWATRGWGDGDVANAMLAATVWPVTGTTVQARVEASLRPHFSQHEWAELFVARFARVAGEGSLSLVRAAKLVGMCSHCPPSVAMQAVRFLTNGWTCARRMGRVPRACVFGCVAEDGLRHYAQCLPLRRAALQAGGELRPFFGVLMPGAADLRQIAVAAEVYNSAAHRRTAEEVADIVMQAGGAATLAAEAVRLARSVAEAMPTARRWRRRL